MVGLGDSAMARTLSSCSAFLEKWDSLTEVVVVYGYRAMAHSFLVDDFFHEMHSFVAISPLPLFWSIVGEPLVEIKI